MATRIQRNTGGTSPFIDYLELDAATSLSLELPSTVTSFPVEDGSKISDHITPDSRQLNIEGIVSSATNSLKASVVDRSTSIIPKSVMNIASRFIDGGVVGQFLNNKPDYDITTPVMSGELEAKPQLAMEFFNTIRSKRELVSVIEGDGTTHKNMAITNVRRLRDAEIGIKGIGLSLTFQEIRIVSSKSVKIKQQRKPAASLDKKQAGDTTNSNVKTSTSTPTAQEKSPLMIRGEQIYKLRGGG